MAQNHGINLVRQLRLLSVVSRIKSHSNAIISSARQRVSAKFSPILIPLTALRYSGGYNQLMLWRSAKQHLTQRQELIASQHFARLLKRWAGNVNQSRCARLWANARCLALHPERLT